MLDTCSNVTEKSTETAEALKLADEWKRKCEVMEASMKKRRTKRQKRIEKKTARLKVDDIPPEKCLNSFQKYQLRTYVSKTLWRHLKFWNEELEAKVVKRGFKIVDVKTKEEKAKFRDFTSAYIQEHIDSKRNNSVAALGKAVKRNPVGKYLSKIISVSTNLDTVSNQIIKKQRSCCLASSNHGERLGKP